MTWCLQGGLLEPEEEAIIRQRPDKHAPMATDMYVRKEEPQDGVHSMQSMLGLYSEEQWGKWMSHKLAVSG
jgi:hypothetical protein